MTNLLLAIAITTNWTYVGQFTPLTGSPQEVRRGQIVTNINLALQWKGELKILPLEQQLGPVIGEYLFLLNTPLPTQGNLVPAAAPFPKKPRPQSEPPPMPPAAAPRKSTNAVAKGIVPLVIQPGMTIAGFPRFTIMTNAAKSATVVILPAPTLSISNEHRYINIDNNAPIFSADAYGMAFGSNYVIEVASKLPPVWNRYYGPFQWTSTNPYSYLRFEDVIFEMPCVPEAPNGATLCIPTERYWRIRWLQ